MKLIDSKILATVAQALNFSCSDLFLEGECEVYTTKAAGGDIKLYKNIENTLEDRHENLVRLSASLSPDQRPVDSRRRNSRAKSTPKDYQIDLSRPSPFGSLHEVSSRRTFAYMIATLNAAHDCYDFSNTLCSSDFRRTSGTKIRRTVDDTLLPLRPRRMLPTNKKRGYSMSVPAYSDGEAIWGEHMWKRIDQEMDMHNCEKYVWEPELDPFVGEDKKSLWAQHYFFFNKEKKRVLYLRFAAYSVISNSPVEIMYQRAMPRTISGLSDGAEKRARYWLGRSVDDEEYDDEYAEGEEIPSMDDMRDKINSGNYYDDEADDEAYTLQQYAEEDDVAGHMEV